MPFVHFLRFSTLHVTEKKQGSKLFVFIRRGFSSKFLGDSLFTCVFCGLCRRGLRGADSGGVAEHLLHRRAGVGTLLPRGVDGRRAAVGVV